MKHHTLRVILPVAAIQFIYLLDFIVLLPLGPDIAQALQFPSQELTLLSGAYTLAAVIAGLFSIRWLDQLPRKRTLLYCLTGLATATCLTALAQTSLQLMLTRALTGFFGSPTVALAMAIVIDTTPPAERGKTIGKVMLGFSVATIGGIPLALEISHLWGWHTVFYTVGALAYFITFTAACLLPQPEQVPNANRNSPLALLKKKNVQTAGLSIITHQMATFLIVPIFTAFFVFNLNYPREHLGTLYLCGGLASMLIMQLIGRLTDRTGAPLPYFLCVIGLGFGLAPLLGLNEYLPLTLTFLLFMGSNAGRNVSLMSLTSQVPAPPERASYLALQNIIQDTGITLAALLSGAIISTSPEGQLQHTPALATIAILLALISLANTVRLQRALKNQSNV